MKKSVILALTLILAVVFLASCSSHHSEATEDLEIPVNEVEVVPCEEEAILLSKEEVISSLRENNSLPKGFWVENGYLYWQYISGGVKYGPMESLGSIHTLSELPKSFDLLAHSSASDTYRVGDQLIQYELGEITHEVTLYKDAIYGGHSFWCGYLFRTGNEVYAINLDGYTQTLGDVEKEISPVLIASGVKMILSPDYALTSDAWSQPLFLMEDGSVKAYCEWEDNLVAPYYEGGYGGTWIGQ